MLFIQFIIQFGIRYSFIRVILKKVILFQTKIIVAMLNKLLTNILLSYLYIGIALLVLCSLVISDCDIVILMSSMFYLMTFVGITYYYNKVDDSFYNNKRVFFLVFIYSLLFVYIYYNISLYRNNDIMVFCYSDAS